MPRFYINFRNRDGIAKDLEGTELPSLEAARELALVSAREVIAQNVKADSPKAMQAVIITDESGRAVVTIAAQDVLPEALKG